MNTINKKTIVGLVAGLLIVMLSVGCNNFLNKKPLGEQTSETFFQTQQDAVDATNATYQSLQTWQIHVFSWLGLTDIISDDADKGSTPTDAPFLLDLDNLQYDPGNLAFADPWAGYYRGIFRANQAITYIPKISDMDATLKARLIAENAFLRAYFYFFLVRGWENVPLITKPLLPSEYYNRPNSTADSVYAQIIRDLMDAVQNLPLKSQYASSDLGRATKGSAEALLAKVYLFRGDYTNALNYAEMVINSNEYGLAPDYANIFRLAGENSSENVFSVENTATASGQGGSQYNQVQGVRGDPNLGWGFNNPSQNLLASYEQGDPRQEATTLFVWESLPDGSGLAVHDNPNMNNEDYNQKAFVPLDHIGGQGDGPGNIRIIRYSDVLLIAAEAAYQTGDATKAQQYLNMVRNRARGGQTSTIGASVEAVAPIIADTLNMPGINGMPFIRYVWNSSPASNAGLKRFAFSLENNSSLIVVDTLDVIQSLNGTAVNSMADYMNAMQNISPGQNVTVTVERIMQTYNNQTQSNTTTTQTVVANMTTSALLPDVTATGTDLLHAIWQERRSELAMEQHRWFDLLRQNTVQSGWAQQEMAKAGKVFTNKNTIFPIPTTEIDLSNGTLKQNTVWIGQ